MIENIYNKKISEITSINSGDFGYSTEGSIVEEREVYKLNRYASHLIAQMAVELK